MRAEEQICIVCHQPKPVEDFPFRKKSTGIRRGHCKACKKRYDQDWYGRNEKAQKERTRLRNRRIQTENAKRVDEYKSSTPCMDCGGLFPACAMDFDHRDFLSKDSPVSDLRRSANSWSKITNEIAKCDLVCACCHRIRTWVKRHHPLFLEPGVGLEPTASQKKS